MMTSWALSNSLEKRIMDYCIVKYLLRNMNIEILQFTQYPSVQYNTILLLIVKLHSNYFAIGAKLNKYVFV